RRPSGGPLERRRALDHLSFEVQAGEAFAIIGPNGAGKTTALKLMARISLPSAGRIRLCGRVGALIEVGAGIHPELTGRENIWLYGRFVGMTRAALAQRFDEILDFCELAYVLDEPVKTYSTGMQLRLGFAVASHVDPDILVVDEALAVGDAAFQAKCSERMAHLLRLGRTLVLVSHNLSAVEALCARGLLLIEGRARSLGPVHQVVRDYIDWVDAQHHSAARPAGALLRGGGLVLTRLTAHALDGDERYVFRPGEGIEVRLTVQAETAIRSPWFSLGVSDGRPGALIMCSMLERAEAFDLAPGEHQLLCRLPALPLAPRAYELWLSVLDVACGTGYGSALVLRAGARRVVAVDHSVPALTFGRGRYPGVRYLLADAGALPLRAGSADVVISLETLEHLVDALPFLRALRGIVREDGVLLVSTPNAAQTDGSNPYHVHEM